MATIGTFTRTNGNGSFTGTVRTLSINTKTTIKPADKPNDRAPDYRILTGSAVEFGAAWTKTSGEGREYLSVKLDVSSFPAPIYARTPPCGHGRTASTSPNTSCPSRAVIGFLFKSFGPTEPHTTS